MVYYNKTNSTAVPKSTGEQYDTNSYNELSISYDLLLEKPGITILKLSKGSVCSNFALMGPSHV